MGLGGTNPTGNPGAADSASGGGGGACSVKVTAPISGDGSSGAPLLIPLSSGPTGINPSGVDGYMSATQAAQLGGLDAMFTWYINRQNEVKTLLPLAGGAVTRWEPAKYGYADFAGVTSTSISPNATQQGGAALIPAATTTYLTQTIIGTPKTGTYAVAFGFAMRVLTSPHVSWLGLISIAQTTQAVLKIDTTVADFQLLLKGTGGADQLIDLGVPLDTNPHNAIIVAHAGQTSVIFDGALKATSPNNNNMTDTPVAVWVQNDGNGEINPICGLYGYVDGLPP